MSNCKPYVIVNTCPGSKESWDARAAKMEKDLKCDFESVYHCLPDKENKKLEKCLQKTLIGKGNCPIFTSDGYLDWKECNTSKPACPSTSFVSNEVYKYSLCYENNTRTGNQTSKYNVDQDVDSSSLGLIIGIVGLSILLIFVAAMYITRKKRKGIYVDEITLQPLLSEEIKRGGKQESDKMIKAVARKELVKEGVSTLLKEEVKYIFVVGALGNSVTYTSTRILRKYAKHKRWNTKYCLYDKVPNPDGVDEKTIMFVNGWFGLWNDDLCSLSTAETACEKLKKIQNRTQNVKIIIGMRADIYRKYRKNLEINNDFFLDVIHLDSTTTRKEYSTYFKNIQRSCTDPKCPCKKLSTKMLREGKDQFIGMPLKINIIANHHDPELIEEYITNGHDIIKAMAHHFRKLKENEEQVYKWIEYACLKGEFSLSDLESHDKGMLNEIGSEIRPSFEENESKLKRYFRIKTDQEFECRNGLIKKGKNAEQECKGTKSSFKKKEYVFWHPFIYICAFHFLYKSNPERVIKLCNMDAILQLVRPIGQSNIEVSANDEHRVRPIGQSNIEVSANDEHRVRPIGQSYIEVSALDEHRNLFEERFREIDKHENYKNHPLVKWSSESRRESVDN